jgi:polysaccharide deacetylase family protein (PEP-CTERM system associated)
MIHALTVDVEDYENVTARDLLGREGPPTRAVVENTQCVLTLFADRQVRGTFFVLGEVAREFPELIRDIAGQGHELGVHGYYHRQVFKLTPTEFRQEVAGAKALIEQIAGEEVRGHRAPAFSITPATSWALDVLADVGFRYDSSIFPIAGRRYGWPRFPPDIHRMALSGGSCIVEAPLSTVSVCGRQLPVCGGGYLRHLPLWFTRWAMRRIQRDRPVVVYFHPVEMAVSRVLLDTSRLDRVAARLAQRKHRLQLRNRHTMKAKVSALLSEFEFAPLTDVIATALERAGQGPLDPQRGMGPTCPNAQPIT